MFGEKVLSLSLKEVCVIYAMRPMFGLSFPSLSHTERYMTSYVVIFYPDCMP